MYEVVFAEGSFTTTVQIPITDDSIGEGDEIFYGSLAPIGAASVAITRDRADVTIVDNDGTIDSLHAKYCIYISTLLVFSSSVVPANLLYCQ